MQSLEEAILQKPQQTYKLAILKGREGLGFYKITQYNTSINIFTLFNLEEVLLHLPENKNYQGKARNCTPDPCPPCARVDLVA